MNLGKINHRQFLGSLALLAVCCCTSFGATEYSRWQDFRAATPGLKNTHSHGGLLAADTTRWSYYLIKADQRQDTKDLGPLLSNPEVLTPLTGFSETVIGSNHFQRHSYHASADQISLIWNRSADLPQTDLANASLVAFFHTPAAGTYSITGDLFWRSTTNFDMRRGAGVDIGILRSSNRTFEPLFSAQCQAAKAFTDPKPVEGFAKNPALQNLKLTTGDKIVFLWQSDRTNYRGLVGIDKAVRIVHLEGKPLPTGQELAAMTTFQRLFSLMDLEQPALTTVKAKLEQNDYSAAMEAYIRGLAERLAKLPRQEKFSYWLYGVASANQLLDGKLTTVKYGDNYTRYTFDIGKPGSIDFFKAATDDYRTTTRDNSSMFWPTKHAEAYQNSKDPKYLRAWLATWDDFARNWETQYAETRKDPTIWGRRPDGRANLVGIDWLNAQLYLAWRLESMHSGLLACLQTAHDANQIDQIDNVMLARILVRMATGEAARSRNWLSRAEYLVPNQIRHLAGTLFTWGVQFPEFTDSKWWRSETVPIFTLTHNPDGTDREHSLNYFANNLTEILELLHQLPPESRDPQFLAEIEEKSAYRDRVKPALVRPDGILPTVGKNNIWRDYGQNKPFDPPSKAFTSILFPYNGFTIQRDNWHPDSLYLFMRGNRPAIGHWRDQDGGLQLSAYGRNLLVSAIGEMYDDRNGKWSGYFYSAVGQNTILVDGMSHQRRKGGFDQLDDLLWHTSENIELMETEMSGVYGGWDFRVDGSVAALKHKEGEIEKRPDVTDISHRRQVHFLRQAKCWIVTDRLDSEKPHDFTQTWCFGPEFKTDDILTDPAKQQIRTVQTGAPNLSLYQVGLPNLDYKKYFGIFTDSQILGWTGILADRDKWQYTPKVDTHANWRGKGKQLLITLMVPGQTETSPIKALKDIGKGWVQGFDAELTDGTRIFYRAAAKTTKLEADSITATAQSLLVIRTAKGVQSGMVLGATRFNDAKPEHPDFEFAPDGKLVHVKSPTTFRWTGSGQNLKPAYSE